MSVSENAVLLFISSFLLTLYSSYIGDDDVVYNYMGRKPTPHEGLARIRFIFIKTLAALFGGGVATIFIGLHILKEKLNIPISQDQSVLMIVFFMIITNLLIGVFQNLIRKAQKRKTRPLIDITVWKYNLRQWRNR